MAVFVEEGGVRFDNAGPIPAKQVKRLVIWLERYLMATEGFGWR